MNVNSRFFSRKEEQAKLFIAYNCGRHFRHCTGLSSSSRLTFELSGRRRHGALDSKRNIGHRPSA